MPITNLEQPSVLALHRVRPGLVKARIAQAQQIRGLLGARRMDQIHELDKQVGEFEPQIKTWHRASQASCKIELIPGIGPITASALVASVGNAKNFDDGRQLAASPGRVPKQHSSDGKSTWLGSSRQPAS